MTPSVGLRLFRSIATLLVPVMEKVIGVAWKWLPSVMATLKTSLAAWPGARAKVAGLAVSN